MDPYTLPAFRVSEGAALVEEEDGFHLKSVAVETTLDMVDESGDVVGVTTGIVIETYIP